MPLSRSTVIAMICASAVLLGACEPRAEATPQPVSLDWQELSLPLPAGAAGRLIVSDAVSCAGHSYVVGAIASGEDNTQPAVWESTSSGEWSPMVMEPLSFYGRQAVLYSAGCRDGKLAAIGAKRGGAHGNPRVTTWYVSAEHTLRQVDAPFGLYGGPFAVNVARIAGGRDGWLITGNRTSGAAVWNSVDATEFRLIEGVPPLASETGFDTWGSDAVWHDGRWTMVGGVLRKGRIDRDPIAWTSADGLAWRRDEPTASNDYDEFQRVAGLGASVVAVGIDGGSFRAWRSVDGVWRQGGRFGTTIGLRPPIVNSLTAFESKLIATVVNNEGFTAWLSDDLGDSWRSLATPVPLGAANDRSMVMAGGDGSVLLVMDDAKAGRVWQAKSAASR